MAAPKFTPTTTIGDVTSYRSPDVVPGSWTQDRPGDLAGRQPTGPWLGYQGPDQGYALTLAARLRPQLVLSDNERADAAVAGCSAVAMRRASMFGRAPVIHDLRIAFTIWGFLDTAPPAELVALRVAMFEGAGDPHQYDTVRAIAELVPEATLRLSPDDVARSYPARWRDLIGVDAVSR